MAYQQKGFLDRSLTDEEEREFVEYARAHVADAASYFDGTHRESGVPYHPVILREWRRLLADRGMRQNYRFSLLVKGTEAQVLAALRERGIDHEDDDVRLSPVSERETLVEIEHDLTIICRWFCELGDAPFLPGTLLHYAFLPDLPKVVDEG